MVKSLHDDDVVDASSFCLHKSRIYSLAGGVERHRKHTSNWLNFKVSAHVCVCAFLLASYQLQRIEQMRGMR